MQDALFETKLKRLDLLKLKNPDGKRHIRINVFRNHSFEMIENAISPFLNYTGFEAAFCYSDYDDSLNFGEIESADLSILWLDLDRYKTNRIEEFLTEKANELYEKTHKPILLAYTGNCKFCKVKTNFMDFFIVSTKDALQMPDTELFDLEKEPFSGTRLSNKACINLARIIGFQYIPHILKTQIKAIVFDLDNTLYNGILGEDGISGIVINETHKSIYLKIKELKTKGIMICLASKNEEQDVLEFIRERDDFTLQKEDFAVYEINWNLKSENLLKIAKKLNIGLNSILFIDDNPAEIQNVEMTNLGIKTILAKNPEFILNVLNYYPGLLRLKSNKEDTLRTKDVQANTQRTELAKTLSTKEYFEKLEIKLDYYINNEKHIPRVTELLNKTNQFIFTYLRPSEDDVKNFMQENIVITVNMSDKLSDSGIIAILVADKKDNELNLKELTVSCRALGRNIEEPMINKLFEIAAKNLKTGNKIKINYKKGPRNMPAISFIEQLSGQFLKEEGFIFHNIAENIDTDGLILNIYEAQNAN